MNSESESIHGNAPNVHVVHTDDTINGEQAKFDVIEFQSTRSS